MFKSLYNYHILQKMISSGLKHYYKQYTSTHIYIVYSNYHIIINITYILSRKVYGTGTYQVFPLNPMTIYIPTSELNIDQRETTIENKCFKKLKVTCNGNTLFKMNHVTYTYLST